MDRRNVLIIDDEPEIKDILVRELRANGWTTEAASDGMAALAKLKLYSFDVILSDINMPGLGGMALLNAVRLSGDSIPCVFLTASQDATHMKEGLRLGAFDYLDKPVPFDELKSVLTRAIELSRNKRALDAAAASAKPEEAPSYGTIAQVRAKNNLRR